MTRNDVRKLIDSISLSLFGIPLTVHLKQDEVYKIWNGDSNQPEGRLYIQISYEAKDTKLNNVNTFKGRKWYLSEFMTEDEVVKTVYSAFEQAVKHELMEGFKVQDIIVFNPHVNYKELMSISHLEVGREDKRLTTP